MRLAIAHLYSAAGVISREFCRQLGDFEKKNCILLSLSKKYLKDEPNTS
jgi:hypothetical protein